MRWVWPLAGAVIQAWCAMGQRKGVVTAGFMLPKAHAALGLLEEQGIETEGELVIRRIQNADGPSRATINDQPVSLNLLRQIAGKPG